MAIAGPTSGGGYAGARGGVFGRPRPAFAAFAWLEARLDEERGRWFLWLPVLYGVGIGLYLAVPREPPLTLALAMFILAVTARHVLRLTALRLIASTTMLMLAAGFLTAKLRALIVDAPVLARSIGATTVTGRIEAVERYQKAFRVTVRIEAMDNARKENADKGTPRGNGTRREDAKRDGGTAAPPPTRAKLRYHAKTPLPPVGSRIKIRASLRPPPEPVIPGGFDFARNQWFEGLGATGFIMGKVEVLDGPPPPLDIRIAAMVSALREAIAARIAAVLTGERAGLAQALIMGERAGLGEQTRRALADSGLAHVVSISGFHMALTAGTAFWLIRALLAAFPALALAFPIKVWAAVAALGVASLYLTISGSSVAAVRSYIMMAIVFAAVILNRPALSLRNLAISAMAILAVMPESLADPGFQMSFAATAALIAIYEERLGHLGPPDNWPWLLAVPARALIGVVLTSLAASLAVDPIGAYHFHRIPIYSILGNALAMPAVSVVVMPMALLSLVAMPFGLEAWPLIAMGWGIDMMLGVAGIVAGLPGASIPVPAFGLPPLLAMVGGGLWLLLWRGTWRFAGLVPIAAGLAAAPFAPRPDIWIDREGQVIAVRMADGRLSAPKTRKGEFSLKAWLESDGDARKPREAAKGEGFQCDEHSCLALVRGRIVSHVFHPAALADDCRRASVLIASIPVTEPCPAPLVLIDARDLWEKGARTVFLGGSAGASGRVAGGAAGDAGARRMVHDGGGGDRPRLGGVRETDGAAGIGGRVHGGGAPRAGEGGGVAIGGGTSGDKAGTSGDGGMTGGGGTRDEGRAKADDDTTGGLARPTAPSHGGFAAAVRAVAEERGARPWAVARHRRELIAPTEARDTGGAGDDAERAEGLGGLDALSR